MSKKILSLMIAILMIAVVITGCSTKSEKDIKKKAEDEQNKTAITLSMYLVSENKISDETVTQIEEAVNRITKAKFRTLLKLRYFTEDEYYEELEKRMSNYIVEIEERIKNAKNTTTTTVKSGEQTTEETVTNKFGLAEIAYPEITDNQVDIFYFAGYDKFLEYTEKGSLSKLDTELTSSSKLLTSFISPDLLTCMKAVGNGTYALPTNRAIGEYTCLVMNKEVLKYYGYLSTLETTDIQAMFASLTSNEMQDLLNNVSKDYAGELMPLYMQNEVLPVSGIHYWGVSTDGKMSTNFSVIGGTYEKSWSYKTSGQYPLVTNLLSDEIFIDQSRIYMTYKENGYITTNESEEFAVGYVKGGAEIFDKYDSEKYVTITLDYPTLTTTNVCEHMFGVFAKTANLSRSMEILTYINTNEDLRNLLQYGIENEHYEIKEVKDSDGNIFEAIEMLNDKYVVDPYKMGNNILLKPTVHDIHNVREYDRIQLRDFKTSIDMAFEHALKSKGQIADKSMQEIRVLSEKIYADILACETLAEFNELLTTANAEVNANIYVKKMLDATYTTEVESYKTEKETYGEGNSLAAFYIQWLKDLKIYVDPPAAE